MAQLVKRATHDVFEGGFTVVKPADDSVITAGTERDLQKLVTYQHGRSHNTSQSESSRGKTKRMKFCNDKTPMNLTLSTPAVRNCCCSKGLAPYWSNPPFLIFVQLVAIERVRLSV